MKLFRKIRDHFEREASVDTLFDDIKNLDEVLLTKRLEILNEIASPVFKDIGLKNWNRKYLWSSDFNDEGIKHVIEYKVFKGYSGGFSFGNCFDFIPTLSGKRLINHRTDKSTKIIYFKRSSGWQNSIDTHRHINPDRINTASEKKFRKSLTDVLKNNIKSFDTWFKFNYSIEANIESLLNDIKNPPTEIGTRIISFEYILAFLYKHKGDLKSAEYWINEHFRKGINSEFEKDLILKRFKN